MAAIPAAATAAVRKYFPPSVQATALAIAGAETGWTLEPSRVDVAAGRPYTCPADSPVPAPFSFGGWQVSLEYYAPIIPGRDMCQKAAYLLASWDNSARIAAAVWRGRGDFGAWSTWWTDAADHVGPGEGSYLAYLPAAQQALGQAVTATAPAATTVTPVPAGGGGLGGLGVPLELLAGALLLEEVL